MSNNLFKELSALMDTVEKDSVNKIYLFDPTVNTKAYNLLSAFCISGINAKIEYNPAYQQIIVIADTYVLDIHTSKLKQALYGTDVICIDSTADGLIHLECIFNNAFKKAGVINEQ